MLLSYKAGREQSGVQQEAFMGTNVFEERSRRTEMSPALGSAEPLCRYTGSVARAAPGARSHPWAVIRVLCSAPCSAGRLLYGQIRHCPGGLAEGSSELSQWDISKGKEMGLGRWLAPVKWGGHAQSRPLPHHQPVPQGCKPPQIPTENKCWFLSPQH